MKRQWKKSRSGRDHSPARRRWGEGTRGKEGGWVIPYCATAPPWDAQECCTQRSFWLCPCCCWARCLWWCRTGGRRERSHLEGEAECRHEQPTLVTFLNTVKLSDPGSIDMFVLTCPHDQHHHDDDELPCPQLGGLAHFLHRHFVWRRNMFIWQLVD